MSIAAFYSGILMTTILVVEVSTFCARTITCPCGSSGHNYTHYLHDDLYKKCTCDTWVHCQTCKPNITHCITCPPKRFGPTCTEVTKELIRSKRQFSYSSCPHLGSPKSGSTSCTQKGNYRTCTATCLPGYHFEDEEDKISITLKCHGSTWKPRRKFPPCKSGGFCGLAIKGSGRYNCTTSTDGTRCDITCGSRKAGRYLCYPGRDWNPRLPSCAIPKAADKIALLTRCLCQNGGTCVEGGRCICPSGTTGSFCESQIESTGRDCNLQISGAGAYNCTISSDETVCDITCDNVPRGRYRCRLGKEWRPQLPYCITLKGTAPEGTRTPRQSACRCENGGSCEAGERCVCPSGFTGSRCENGPTATCPDPGNIPFGYRRLRNGIPSRFSQTYSIGQYFQFFCNQGYLLQGNSVLNCLPSGKWSSSLPWCRSTQTEPTIYCSDPGRISFGSYSNSDGNSATSQQYTVGKSVNYYCQNGYGLVGSSVVSCLPSGSWSRKPICRRVITSPIPADSTEICPDPGTIQFGYRRLRNGTPSRFSQTYRHWQSFQFFCNQGYTLEGSSLITCLPSGEWSSSLPRCQNSQINQYSCRYPGQNPNSRLTTYVRRDEIFPPTTQLTYVCDDGYETRNPLITYCLTSGYWSSPPPTCNRMARTYCTLPEIDVTGMIIETPIDINDRLQTFPPGAEIKFDCDDGYEIDRNIWIIYCKQNGDWTTEPPKCKRNPTSQAPATSYCSHPGVDPNGIMDDYNGVTIVGQRQVYHPGAELKYRCNDGYEVVGASNLVCTLEGEWSDDPPACRIRPTTSPRIVCPTPIADPNGEISYIPANDRRRRGQGYEAGSEITFTCKNGYELIGRNSIICLINGQWNNSPPTCERISRTAPSVTCRDPGSLRNGGVIVYYNSRNLNSRSLNDSDINNAGKYPVRTRLSYDCKSGYRLVGEKNLVCRSTGSWEGRKPSCIEDCGVSTLTAGPKITHGKNTTAGEFPWIVFLYMNETSDTCAGVLIDRRTVLTAAHCLATVSYCTLYFGKFNRSDEYDDAEVKTRTSTEIIVHSQFNPVTFENDIAMVKFSPDVPYSERIQSICMPSTDTTLMNIVKGQMGYVVGWGVNENQRESKKLMLANLPIEESQTCISAYVDRGFSMTITEEMFCAGYTNNVINACRGDSGSPMLFYNNQTERFVVEGVVSHGTSGRCDRPARYTMFTRVSSYLQWIYDNWRPGNM